MLNKKNGYTLAEVLVVLTLLGILAAILLPAVSKIRPDRDKMMFKKAYYVAERIIYEIVNDDDLYMTKEGNCVGLACTGNVSFGGNTYGSDTGDANFEKTKFCGLFARKVNTGEDIKGYHNGDNLDGKGIQGCETIDNVPVANGGLEVDKPSFITSDGVAWYMPASKFEKPIQDDEKLGEATIYVDVNGNKKKPNCLYNSTSCTKPDIFKIHVISDGKVYVDGVKETEYLQSNTNTR